jgi:hypothetical protein
MKAFQIDYRAWNRVNERGNARVSSLIESNIAVDVVER